MNVKFRSSSATPTFFRASSLIGTFLRASSLTPAILRASSLTPAILRASSLILIFPVLVSCALIAPEREAASAPATPPSQPVQAEPTEVVLPELPPEEPQAPAPAEPNEPAIRPTNEQTRGRLSKAAIQKGIEPSLPAFEVCYTRALVRVPDLQGTVMVNFVIAPDGTVPFASALEQGTTLEDSAVVECVLEEFQKLQFDAPVGGRVVTTYPLRFAPANAAP